MSEPTAYDVSRWLEYKRQKLRDLYKARHQVDYWLVNVRLSMVYDFTEMLKMAIKKNKKDATKKADFRGFFNYEMTPEAKTECKNWIREDELVALEIEQAIASGYSVKITMDNNNAGYQATMQANDPKDVNAGLCMSGYAKHWYDALAVVIFKHAVLLKYRWEDSEETPSDEDFS